MAYARSAVSLFLVACSSGDCGRASGSRSEREGAPFIAPVASSIAPNTSVARMNEAAHANESSLGPLVVKIEAGDRRDGCEEKVREYRRAVAAAVDRAWPAIEARGTSLAEAPPYRRSRLGPTYVRERDIGPRASFEQQQRFLRGWKTVERSWAGLAANVAALAFESDGGPIDEAWVVIARDARALASFDLARVALGTWRDAARSSLPPQVLSPNPGVERVGSVLTVLLDPAAFDGEKVRLGRIIEGAWTSRALAVHVRWTSQSSEPRAHRLVSGRVAGEPSYVTDRLRQVHLAPDMPAAAVAHEIGHVLGFSDHYAKTYDANRCAYFEERDARDIMSDPEGPVLPEHWTLLADAYRNAPPSRPQPKP